MVRVGQLMTKELVAVEVGTPVSEIARVMSMRRIGSVLVKRREELIGIVTESDIVRRGIGQGRDLRAMSAVEIMSSPIISIDERRPITEAADLMQQNGTRHLGVCKGQQMVGVVSVRDFLHPVSLDEL